MAARKSERLLNLLITLLVSRSYVTKERIRSVVEQYRDAGDDAFEKMFERDKEELRSLGIPIEVGHLDKAFEGDPGYRIERSAFELPQIDLGPDEAAVLGLAARVWQHAGLASATSDALVKLKAAGVTVDRAALNVAQPQLAVEEPTFEAFWSAIQARTPVAFSYRSSGAAQVTLRHLQPWGVVSYRGRWYAVGHDTDREAPRLFRLSRVQGGVVSEGKAGSFVAPEGTDIRELTVSLAPPSAEQHARLLVRPGAALGLRRQARALPAGGHQSWDRLEVSYGRPDAMADEVLGYGSDVVVELPEELRSDVMARLREVATAGHTR
ncbi:MAG: WYL domain-containing protein [Actinomycetota bacterium]|nr:WYL domain-containing protein [Actinomycetota bacterium]